MKLSDNIFYLDLKGGEVKQAQLIELGISPDGYIMATHTDEDGTAKRSNYSLIYPTQEEAQEALNKFKPINDELADFIKDCDEKAKLIRKQIIGEPECPNISKQ